MTVKRLVLVDKEMVEYAILWIEFFIQDKGLNPKILGHETMAWVTLKYLREKVNMTPPEDWG